MAAVPAAGGARPAAPAGPPPLLPRFALEPGVSVGPFRLGMPLGACSRYGSPCVRAHDAAALKMRSHITCACVGLALSYVQRNGVVFREVDVEYDAQVRVL